MMDFMEYFENPSEQLDLDIDGFHNIIVHEVSGIFFLIRFMHDIFWRIIESIMVLGPSYILKYIFKDVSEREKSWIFKGPPGFIVGYFSKDH